MPVTSLVAGAGATHGHTRASLHPSCPFLPEHMVEDVPDPALAAWAVSGVLVARNTVVHCMPSSALSSPGTRGLLCTTSSYKRKWLQDGRTGALCDHTIRLADPRGVQYMSEIRLLSAAESKLQTQHP